MNSLVLANIINTGSLIAQSIRRTVPTKLFNQAYCCTGHIARIFNRIDSLKSKNMFEYLHQNLNSACYLQNNVVGFQGILRSERWCTSYQFTYEYTQRPIINSFIVTLVQYNFRCNIFCRRKLSIKNKLSNLTFFSPGVPQKVQVFDEYPICLANPKSTSFT